MNKNRIRICALITTLLFLAMPAVSAHIGIIDIGHHNAAQWDDIEGWCGYVVYQNVVNYTVEGAILVFVDGEIVSGKILNMKIHYVGGFRCSPIRTLEFPITETEGRHEVAVYIYSMNSSAARGYEYTAEGRDEVEESVSGSEIDEDWLECWGCKEG